ncbi:hypothetical protein HMPREF3208_00357, partial [Gardnerella vaginalis]
SEQARRSELLERAKSQRSSRPSRPVLRALWLLKAFIVFAFL